MLYVAMTRAKDNMTLGLPPRFYVTQQTQNGDRHIYAMRTRFIPSAILDRFEAVTWSSAAVAGEARPAPAPIDVAASMRAMWGYLCSDSILGDTGLGCATSFN